MASASRRASLAANRQKAAATPTVHDSAPDSFQDDPPEEGGLDSLKTQAAILNPEPLKVTIGGKAVQLYPLPAKASRQFAGLVSQIMYASRNALGLTSTERIVGVLTEEEVYSDKFVTYVARAQFQPDASFEQLKNMGEVAREIDEKASFAEMSELFAAMVEKNKTVEAYSHPK